MRVFHRQIIVLAVLTAATAIFLNGTKLGLRGFGSGNSFLSNTNYFGSDGAAYHGLLFGNHKSWESMGLYLSMSGEYDLLKNQGLMNAYGEAAYHGRLSQLAQSALSSFQNHHISVHGKFFANEVDDALGLKALRRKKGAVMYAGIFLAAYSGRTLRYEVGDQFSIESRTRMSDTRFGSQYFGWKSNALEASLGATYSADQHSSSLNLRKRITNEVSVNYEASQQQQHSVGVTFSKGF